MRMAFALSLVLLVSCRLGGRPLTVTWAEPKKEEDTSKVRSSRQLAGSAHARGLLLAAAGLLA
jgi:hypothetical protein